MLSRRMLLSSGFMMATGLVALSRPAVALELQPYVASDVEKMIKSGKPVVVHVYAPWCLQCHAQASILSSLAASDYAKISFYRVDYDNQKDIVAALKCPRSTLIAYKGGKEITRMSWSTSEKDVVDVLNAALNG